MKLLKVTESKLTRWRLDKTLPGHHLIRKSTHYLASVVNAFLESCEHNLTQPLTLEQLISGEVELLTVKEAADYTGLTTDVLYIRKQANSIQYIVYPKKRVAIVKASLTPRQDRQPNPTLAQVSVITGISRSGVRTLIAKGELEIVRAPGSKRVFISVLSLVRFLKTRFPDWIDPIDWITSRLASPLPLLRSTEAIQQLGTKKQLQHAMAIQGVQYIAVQGGFRFSPESITEHIAYETILPKETIAAVFGVSLTSLHKWAKKGHSLCPAHGHNHDEYRKSCILGYLSNALTARSLPDDWYEKQTTAPYPLFGIEYAMRYLQQDHSSVSQLFEEGILLGLRLPSGSFKCTKQHLVHCKKLVKNAKR